MLKQISKTILARLGYEVRRRSGDRKEAPGFVLYRYLKGDGTFDYERYRRIQEEGNQQKIEHVWATEQNIRFLSDYIRTMIPSPQFGICHGTRRGMEQAWFRKYLSCEVIGTEISKTAEMFPHTIQWDFHQVKPEWIESVDFIYSNAFDHSYDPELCLNSWMNCLPKGRLCIIEHSSLHEPRGSNELDPFGADLVQMPYLITIWGKGAYGVRALLSPPEENQGGARVHFIVIQKY